MATGIGRFRDNFNYQHVHKAQRVFTNAEVLLWPTTTPELVAAYPNQIIVPSMVVYDFPNWIADYTNIDTDDNKIAVDTPTGDYASLSPTFLAQALLAQAKSTVIWTDIGRDFDYNPLVRANLVGAPLNLAVTNGDGNFTGGDPSDLITVTVFYYIIPGGIYQ